MHAHLLIGNNEEKIIKTAENISGTPVAKILQYEIQKISNVRELSQLVKLASSQKRVILIKNFDNASIEAMNSFLKLLEEPKGEIVYIITAKHKESLLSTIISRVNIIEIKDDEVVDYEEVYAFINKTLTGKIKIIDSIKKRDEAISFIEKYISGTQQLLRSTKTNDIKKLSDSIKVALKARRAIKNNGNVNLQLSNFVILIDKHSN